MTLEMIRETLSNQKHFLYLSFVDFQGIVTPKKVNDVDFVTHSNRFSSKSKRHIKESTLLNIPNFSNFFERMLIEERLTDLGIFTLEECHALPQKETSKRMAYVNRYLNCA